MRAKNRCSSSAVAGVKKGKHYDFCGVSPEWASLIDLNLRNSQKVCYIGGVGTSYREAMSWLQAIQLTQ